MTIGIIGSRGYPYVYSGYETFVAELAEGLVARGHRVVVYCHRSLFPDRPRTVNGVELTYIPAIERKTLSQFSHSLFSTLHVATRDMDVLLYVNSANGPFGLLTKMAGKRTAINVDGLEWLRPKWRGLGAKYFRMASWAATRLFDCVITDSTEMGAIYREEFGADSETIAYGAHLEESVDAGLLTEWGLHPQDYYLVVARLVPDNNADIIVREFAQTSSHRRLVIVGDVPYTDPYARMVRASKDPRVLFPGYVRDKGLLRELFCNAYAYIHGHEHGGTNPSLLKALGCGCAVLALETRFSHEVLAGGQHGFYFTKNAGSFAEQVAFLEQTPAALEEKRQHARERITTAYTWKSIVDKYEDLFLRLASHR